MSEDRHYLILGLDPGIASCGFCLLDMTDHKILEMGVLLFDVPQDSKKVSLAVGRRNARSIRRNNARTKARMKHLVKILVEEGLAPGDASRAWFQSTKGDTPVLKLRARGLDHLLSDREFAQVLYALCRRRGYIPHGDGADDDTDDLEDRKVLKAIAANTSEMKRGGWRTVGEMLNARGASRNKGGDYELCVRNGQIQDEVTKIIEAQRNLGNTKATQRLEKRYLECLTWERSATEHDVKAYALVGHCTYFPEEKRAALADPSSELCRAYERLGHLVIVHEDGSEQTLTSELISQYVDTLFSPTPIKGNKECKVTYGAIRKDLDLPARSVFKGIGHDDETAEPFSPKRWRCLRKHLPESLLARMSENRPLGDGICEALTFASTEASLVERLAPLGLSEKDTEAVLSIPFSGKLFKGYGSRSLKALGLLIDAFEDASIRTLTEAEEATGLDRKRADERVARTRLLPPYSCYDTECHNPVVLRAMGQMRRVINAVIRLYGAPDEIHIELGRELKRSQREKKIISKRNSANKAAKKKWSSIAAGILGQEPDEVPGRIVQKLLLREEQGDKDLYTGSTIDLVQLVKDDRAYEIDHILPYSRTCDDNRDNKALVCSKSNQDKGQRTPYEWMTSGEPSAPSWEEFEARVSDTVKSPRKRAKLLNRDLGPDAEQGFIERNLNDTRYMSVAVRNYIEDSLLFPNDGRIRHVTAVAGGATGNLRWVWGLNFGTDNTKGRTDDRHHAVDAAVIAACSEATVKKVARESAKGRDALKRLRESRLSGTQPWPTFAEEVTMRRERIVPTRMASHGVTGRAYEDTIYHLEGVTDDRSQYSLVRASGRTVKKGNVRVMPDGSTRLVDGLAFLRLWLDPDAKGGRGKWYADPVYYADMPDVIAGRYVPRACKTHTARTSWNPIPDSALHLRPVTLFSGDVLTVDNHIGRFRSFNISNCSLDVRDLLHKVRKGDKEDYIAATGFPFGLSDWTKDTKAAVLQEDSLGHCYKQLLLHPENSTYSFKTPRSAESPGQP